MEDHDHIQIRSDEVEDILGRPPSWIVRYGTTVIFLSMVAVVAISWMIQYSDVIEGSIIVTTPSPPMNIIAETSGRILQLNVNDKDSVYKDDLVAVIESNANYSDMLWLNEKVKRMQQFDKPFSLNKNLKLGEVQFAFSNFQRDFQDYSLQQRGTFDKQQIEQISTQIRNVQRKIDNTKDKTRRLQEQLSLEFTEVRRIENLYRNGAKAITDVNKAKARYKNLERSLDDIKAEELSYIGEIDRLEEKKLEIQRGKIEGGNDKWIQVQQSLNKLAGEIDIWKKKYLITAPIDGKVTFFEPRTELQYINAGEELLMIVPEKEKILGRMKLPITGAGKVKNNQVVNILLHEFPAKEFGVVKGKISNISIIPRDNVYMVDVVLPDGLITTYKDTLSFKQEMSGIAEIITDERRFIFRIFDKFKDLVKN